MLNNLSKRLVCACLLSAQLLTYSTAFAKSGGGAIAGGGGDANEERVDAIRADLLKWINNNGARDLKLPKATSYGEYFDKMTEVLQPMEVVVGFVEKDDEKNEELMVSVDGTPKTCRGFISIVDSKKHILCNISRFKNTSEPEQYKLIHHEYAGLVNIENNEAAASDYAVSSQITDFLSYQTVLKLAVKSVRDIDVVPELFFSRKSYLGGSQFEATVKLKNTNGVLQVTLASDKNKSIILNENNDFSYTQKITWRGKSDEFKIKYPTAIVQYTDGAVANISGVEWDAWYETIHLNYNHEEIDNVIKIKQIKTEDVRSNAAKDSELQRENLAVTYQVSFDISAVDLSKVKGVQIFFDFQYHQDKRTYEEFMSEDPEEIIKFLQEKTRTFRIDYIQGYTVINKGCSDFLGFCLSKKYKATDDYFNYNNRELTIKFITKDEISKFKYDTFTFPNKIPKP